MKKILLFLLSWTGWAGAVTGQGLSYSKISIAPFTHLVVAGSTHLVLTDTDFENNGVFNPGQGAVHFTGVTGDSLLGSANTEFYKLVIDKGVGANFFIPPELPIDGPWSIGNNLTLAGSDNKVILTIRDMILRPGATITGAGPQRFVVTPESGQVVKEGLSDFLFPVGADSEHFNPIRIAQSGQSSIGARCLPRVLSDGDNGNPLSRGVVDASWVISKSQSAPTTLNLSAQWSGSDELIGFDGADCGIAQYLGGGDWDLAGADIGQKTGQDPYFVSRQNIFLQETQGVFAVGSEPLMYPLRVGIKTNLQGAFNTATGLMNDDLRTQQLIPVQEPYSQIPGFTHVGRGGGESVSPNVLGVSGAQAIVDWVFIELRDPDNSAAVLETRAALIRRDGNIVDVDGVSAVTFRGRPSGTYYFDVRHRNHLGIRTPEQFALYNDPVLLYDFTGEQFNAYQGVQSFLGANYGWAMYGGNANSNGNVRYSGPGNDQNALLNGCLGGSKALVLNGVYSTCDLNLNGAVRYSGPLNDQNFLLNNVLGGDKTKVVVQPDF
jgi:hypothetical protein